MTQTLKQDKHQIEYHKMTHQVLQDHIHSSSFNEGGVYIGDSHNHIRTGTNTGDMTGTAGTWDGAYRRVNLPQQDQQGYGWGHSQPFPQWSPITTITNEVILNSAAAEKEAKRRRNIYTSSTGDYHIDIEITGYDISQIDVSSIGNEVTVRLSAIMEGEFIGDNVDDNNYELKEIKLVDEEITFTIPKKYDINSMMVKKQENGLLRIKAPKKEVKQHKVS